MQQQQEDLSTVERVRSLEYRAFGMDLKLDTVIESLKEVNEGLKRLADISIAQTVIQEKYLGLRKDHNDLEKKVDDEFHDIRPHIDDSKTVKTTVKVWLSVATLIAALVGFFFDHSINYAISYTQGLETRLDRIEEKVAEHHSDIAVIKRHEQKPSN